MEKVVGIAVPVPWVNKCQTAVLCQKRAALIAIQEIAFGDRRDYLARTIFDANDPFPTAKPLPRV